MNEFEKLIVDLISESDSYLVLLNEMAEMCSKSGNFTKAIFIREELIKKKISNKTSIMLSLAFDYHKAGMYESSINILEELLTLNKSDYILDEICHIYLELNDWERVLKYQKMKENINEKCIVYALCQWARELIKEGQLEKAIAKLNEAHNISPHSIHIKMHLRDLYIAQKKYDELLTLTNEINQKKPEYFGIFVKNILQNYKIFDSLREIIHRHIERFPSDTYTIYLFSKKLLEDKEYEEAYSVLKNYCKPSSCNISLCKLFIDVSIKAGKIIEDDYILLLLSYMDSDEVWFRCENCGYNFENFSFICSRCNHIDTIKPTW